MVLPEHTVSIRNRDQRLLYATITLPTPAPVGGVPLVLLLHGFKGFRNWAFWPVAAQGLAQQGFAVVRLDFALNGMCCTNDRVIALEDFAQNTLMNEVHDVEDFLEAITQESELATLAAVVDPETLHVIGHSRGGGIAMVVGRRRLEQGKPLTTVTGWNSVGSWERIGPHQIDQWRQQGYYVVQHARTQQELRMNYTYVESYLEHRDELSLQRAVAGLGDRLHFVHAETDLTVPLAEVRRLLRDADRATTIDVIPGSTHTFGMQHPIDHVTPAFAQVLTLTVQRLTS
ncbi:MAG: alpha/beta hydrolase family protein [Candidatus Kapaibacteriota bacterium]